MQGRYHAGYELISNIVRGEIEFFLKKTTNCVGGKSVSVVVVHSLSNFEFLHPLRTNAFTVVSQDQIT